MTVSEMQQEILRLKEMLNGILAEAAGKTLEAVTNDTDRDHCHRNNNQHAFFLPLSAFSVLARAASAAGPDTPSPVSSRHRPRHLASAPCSSGLTAAAPATGPGTPFPVPCRPWSHIPPGSPARCSSPAGAWPDPARPFPSYSSVSPQKPSSAPPP